VKPAVLSTCVFLALIAVAHLLRVVFQVPVVVGSVNVPLWPSAPAVLVVGGLAVWLWREERQPAP
jgi:hypothetical protein